MKRLLVLSLLPLALCLTSCTATNITKLAGSLSKDPAIVSLKVSTVYGVMTLVRVGGTNQIVSVAPDGSVTVGK